MALHCWPCVGSRQCAALQARTQQAQGVCGAAVGASGRLSRPAGLHLLDQSLVSGSARCFAAALQPTQSRSAKRRRGQVSHIARTETLTFATAGLAGVTTAGELSLHLSSAGAYLGVHHGRGAHTASRRGRLDCGCVGGGQKGACAGGERNAPRRLVLVLVAADSVGRQRWNPALLSGFHIAGPAASMLWINTAAIMLPGRLCGTGLLSAGHCVGEQRAWRRVASRTGRAWRCT